MFIAAIFVGAFRRISALHAPLGLAAGGIAAFTLIALLSARAVDSQVWVPSIAETYHQIERAVTTGCADVRQDGTVFLFPLPIGGPNFREYAVPQLIRTIHPETTVLRLVPGSQGNLPEPETNDCGLAWNGDTGYTARLIE